MPMLVLFLASYLMSATTPFKPLFPAPNHLSQGPPSGSPLLFQQSSSNMPTFNPLLQPPPTSSSHLPSSFIQPMIRPPSIPSAFQAPQSAFTPLIPTNNPQSASFIQPKLTIGSAPPLFAPLSQPVPFSLSQIPPMPGMETNRVPTPMIIPPPSFDKPIGQNESQLASTAPPPPPSSAIKDPNPSLPPPPHQVAAGELLFSNLFFNVYCFLFLASGANPYSARASLTERIYPGMPMSQAPLQPQQLGPPVSFQQQQLQQQQPTSVPPPTNLFVPPTNVTSSATPNVYPG